MIKRKRERKIIYHLSLLVLVVAINCLTGFCRNAAIIVPMIILLLGPIAFGISRLSAWAEE
jgi:hypothetical protein